ncbi:hypothetical protein [Agaribacter flavus]|uniref:Glycosyl transferase family 1 domain-containing protein n=1 Tax=Agaribacter flavus TaxID=1902781 RepID=A0ABV7FNQ4_9ALTE
MYKQFYYLQHRAVRICVSDSVCKAISPFANGPCIHIPMGYEFPKFINSTYTHDVYILAKKRPGVGNVIADWCMKNNLKVKCHDHLVPKNEVLSAMASASLSVLLPNETEGFYLPGIEAMYLSKRVLMTDCIANREYVSSESNAVLCEFSLDSILAKLNQMLPELRRGCSDMLCAQQKNAIVQKYNLMREREAYHQLLNELLWKN